GYGHGGPPRSGPRLDCGASGAPDHRGELLTERARSIGAHRHGVLPYVVPPGGAMFHRTDRSATSRYGFSLMFAAPGPEMLASMTETDPRADMPPVNWSELGVGELPTGTVTLLLADVEGSTRLWETQPEEMTAAVARLDRMLGDLLAAHGGVRPVEQGEGDSFVVAFARA